MKFVLLEPSEILEALHEAQKHGVRGGRVHDWLHVRHVQELLTDNYGDFAGLEDGLTIVAP